MIAVIRPLFLVIVATVLVSGCALGRSEVSVSPSASLSNPSQGTAIKIAKIEDIRHFEVDPRQASTPSLSDQDINNTTITTRAIARKRGGFGKALGDVLLPEGQTVAALMQQALTDGFRGAGYQVLAPGDSGYDQAVPISAQIKQYWCWFSPGFFSVSINNRAEVDLSGPLPELGNGLTVHSDVTEELMAVFEEDWKNIATKGLSQTSTNLADALLARARAAK